MTRTLRLYLWIRRAFTSLGPKLGDFMVSEVHSSLEGVDVIALVADRPELGDIEEALIKTAEETRKDSLL